MLEENYTYRTVRYRLHPGSRAAHRNLAGLAGACRYAWNAMLGDLKTDFDYRGRCDFRFYSICKEFVKLRDSEYAPWLQEYSSKIVKASLKPIETACKEFFKDPKGKGLPKFKSKYGTEPSFPVFPAGGMHLNRDRLRIQKIGEVRLSRMGGNPHGGGEWVSGRVKHEGDGWYAYLAFKVPAQERGTEAAVGIDRNCGQIALSDGRIIRLPDLEGKEKKRLHYQRMMSRRVKGSRRRAWAKARYGKACRDVRFARSDWAHKASRTIADGYDVAYLEDLNIKGMTASAKGTMEKPGRNVAQKRGLNKAILGSCWGTLERMLAYKMELAKVPAAYTSQTCHECGHVAKGNRASQSDFKCLRCGHEANADVNAALNILAAGNAAAEGRGGMAVGPPLKRQNDAGSASADLGM